MARGQGITEMDKPGKGIAMTVRSELNLQKEKHGLRVERSVKSAQEEHIDPPMQSYLEDFEIKELELKEILEKRIDKALAKE
ncbi:hypothetical protein [Microvirga tunisiensis]|uniref:Uncharacterized protein n=1 Tax=Microvirga tunisiensis TaxID=2108360 RepID=A0A5N7MWF0_9HYPH|nr:hypothetical protein [Microvirga tunisiensis]MPR10170.1 hypothetical protein [Microvirga tunisiensis]MPR28376.1 hypothetical protein [Microvirga tunisiensis]